MKTLITWAVLANQSLSCHLLLSEMLVRKGGRLKIRNTWHWYVKIHRGPRATRLRFSKNKQPNALPELQSKTPTLTVYERLSAKKRFQCSAPNCSRKPNSFACLPGDRFENSQLSREREFWFLWRLSSWTWSHFKRLFFCAFTCPKLKVRWSLLLLVSERFIGQCGE